MKKSVLLLILVAFSLFSCEKRYQCYCASGMSSIKAKNNKEAWKKCEAAGSGGSCSKVELMY